jgi:hypothetical protein
LFEVILATGSPRRFRARARAGNRIAARIPMIAMTTSNSISVNPRLFINTFLYYVKKNNPVLIIHDLEDFEQCSRK